MVSLSKGLATTAVIAAACCTSAAYAQDAYIVGISAAMTGPAAGTQAPVIEGMKVYIDRLNAKGGINGHPVKLLIEDDQAEPSKAAANGTKLIRQEGAMIFINSSLSSTYGPNIAEAKRANIPIWFAGSVCPKEASPPADPLIFCSTGFDFSYDIPTGIKFIHEAEKEPAKIGLIGMPIPISRIGIDAAEVQAQKLGMTTVDKEFIAPSTADYTPFATKLTAGAPTWGFAYATWITEIKTFEAMRRLGWTGKYLTYGHIQAEDDLARLKDDMLTVFTTNAMFRDDLPIHKEIRDAMQQAKIAYPFTQTTEGWLSGMVLEAVLQKTGWPASTDKILAAMGSLNLDTKGIRGGPLVWTTENHFRTRQYYRFYHWDTAKKGVERINDWIAVDVK
jgi:branched-chain amino acid transport system substrate-binding protein